MKDGVSTVERAFQLAESGQVAGLAELRTALSAEDYDPKQIQGTLLRKQLMAAIKKAKQASASER
jgi:hypothetical protein